MIIDSLLEWRRYKHLGPDFVSAFEFLERVQRNPSAPALGRHAIQEPAIFATLSDVTLRGMTPLAFEWHQANADIHFAISGPETHGWLTDPSSLAPGKEFDPNRDYGTKMASKWQTYVIPIGSFVVFLPGELHAPGLGTGSLRKWVVKVPSSVER